MDEIILPGKKFAPTPYKRKHRELRRQKYKEGMSRLDKELETDDPHREKYIPDNTKYYLNTLVNEISPLLSQNQLIEVVRLACDVFDCVECTKTQRKGPPEKRNEFLLNEFINTKTAESCSAHTLDYYNSTVRKMLKHVGKHADDVTTEDIESYFMYNLNKDKPWSPTTQDNVRRILNSFYSWCVSRRYIVFNPISPIKPTKNKKYRVKKPYTNKDIIRLRDTIDNVRDRAIMELFLSSGIRVAELVGLKRNDMNFIEREFVVLGKGNKQRYAYFDENTGYYLQRYLEQRVDDNESLFVSQMSPYEPLGKTGVESMTREWGKKAGVVGRCHPHRFRHTFATRALNRGIPIEQVQKLLGHEQLDTTLIYAKVARDDVKYNHKKLMNN